MLEAIRQSKYTNNVRHYLVDAYLVDVRMEDILILCNSLFYIERSFGNEEDQSPEARQRYRWKWSKPIVDRIALFPPYSDRSS